jgi:oligopeptidase B
MQPPLASKRPFEIVQHGQARIDEYCWLRNREDPETLEHLKAEQDYLKAALSHTAQLQEEIFAELKGRLMEEDASVPEWRGDFEYYTRLEASRQYPIYCRRSLQAPRTEEILLDQNALAAGKSFCSLGAFQISPDQSKLAYLIDFDGSEKYTLHVKDLSSGALLPDTIPNTYGYLPWMVGLAWAGDSCTLYYTTLDHAHRSDKVFRHRQGSPAEEDELVFHEPDEAYDIMLRRLNSKAYIQIKLHSHKGDEIHLLRADDPQAKPVLVLPRRKNLEYFLEHLGDRFFIATNNGAPNFKLMSAPEGDLNPAGWTSVVPHREDVLIDNLYAFQNHLVLLERKNGLKQLRISGPDGRSEVRYVPFPEPAYNILPQANPEYASSTLRFTYSSLVTPASVIDYHMGTGEWELRKQDKIPSGYDGELYQTERLYAPAADGVQVPISLVYRKGLRRDGQNPLLLYGYGSYGYSVEPGFHLNILSLLERGFVFAMAHVRGGSELGRCWYENGRLLHKRNSFTDLIACADYLVEQGYTRSEKTAIYGGSAGGLLVTAAMCLRPDLCRAVVAAL